MKNWTIAKRIIVGYVVVLALTTALGVLAWQRLNQIQGFSRSLLSDSMPGVIALGKVNALRHENYALLEKHILTTDEAQIAALDKRRAAITEETNDALKDYEATVFSARDRELYDEVVRTRAAYRAACGKVIELSSANKNAEAFQILQKEVDPVYTKYTKVLADHIEFNRLNAEGTGATIDRTVKASVLAIAGGVGVALLLAGGIAFVSIRGTNRVLSRTTQQLDEGSQQVTAAATQVASASQSLAEGASEQAASLEETSSSLEEMAAMTRRNAESANSAKDLSSQTRTAAEAGNTDMEAMREAMNAIKTSSADIAKIIKSIDEIAFQTNILALNAAVEAARAGEAGAGFAVVAEEVRNLAQRSAQSAKETTSKIEVAIRNGERGVEISEKVAASLNVILEKARRVDALVAEIATASHEQSQGVEQLNSAVGQIDKVTQSNSANAEETASAAEELNAQAVSLQGAVAELRRLVGGTGAKAPAEAESAGDEPFAEPAAAAKPVATAPAKPASPAPALKASSVLVLPEAGESSARPKRVEKVAV